MAIVGVTFSKITAEKKNVVKGKVTIANDVTISKIEEEKMALASTKQSALAIKFGYTTKYEPEIGSIEMQGEVLWVDDATKNKKLLADFKKDKTLPMNIKINVFNTILAKATVQAVLMARDVQLPSPIKLPKTKLEEK